MVDSLDIHLDMVIDMPSLEPQPYASLISQPYLHEVFMFSMNNAVMYTGYHKKPHYLFAVRSNKKLKVHSFK